MDGKGQSAPRGQYVVMSLLTFTLAHEEYQERSGHGEGKHLIVVSCKVARIQASTSVCPAARSGALKLRDSEGASG